jgi:hypothetical protein
MTLFIVFFPLGQVLNRSAQDRRRNLTKRATEQNRAAGLRHGQSRAVPGLGSPITIPCGKDRRANTDRHPPSHVAGGSLLGIVVQRGSVMLSADHREAPSERVVGCRILILRLVAAPSKAIGSGGDIRLPLDSFWSQIPRRGRVMRWDKRWGPRRAHNHAPREGPDLFHRHRLDTVTN